MLRHSIQELLERRQASTFVSIQQRSIFIHASLLMNCLASDKRYRLFHEYNIYTTDPKTTRT